MRKAYGKWERGLLNSHEIREKVDEEYENFYNLTKEASLDYFTDPLFNWYDLLRPIALSIEGVKLGPLARYKETNTFYRMPVIEHIGKLGDVEKFREVAENPPFPIFHKTQSSSYIYFLPGINSFVGMSKASREGEGIIEKLDDRYREIVGRLKIPRLLIYEPLPGSDISIYDGLNEMTELYVVITGRPYLRKEVGRKLHSIIGEDPYDLSRLCDVPGIKVVDAMNTKIQTDIIEKVRKYSDDFDRLIISNTESFDFLPRAVADKKVFSFKGEAA